MTELKGKIVHEHVDQKAMANSVGFLAIAALWYAWHIGLLGSLINYFGFFENVRPVEGDGMGSTTYGLFMFVQFVLSTVGTGVIWAARTAYLVYNDVSTGAVDIYNHIKGRKAENETNMIINQEIGETLPSGVEETIDVPPEVAPVIAYLEKEIERRAYRSYVEGLEIQLSDLQRRFELVEKQYLSSLPEEDRVEFMTLEEQVAYWKAKKTTAKTPTRVKKEELTNG